MGQNNDDLYLGNAQAQPYLGATGGENPTRQAGVGPMGRIAYYNTVPLAAANNNIAANQHPTNGTALTLAAGAGVTAGVAPDDSRSTVYVLDVPRCVSLTSAANLSAGNYTLVGFDQYGVKLTSKLAGPNANTVVFPKAVKSVLSITPDTTDGANNVSAGTSDTFGLQYLVPDAVYLTSVRWANNFQPDVGTFTAGDATSPATNATGDVRGTYQPSTLSNGVNRLCIAMHLGLAAAGSTATLAGAYGVPQV